MMTQRGTEDGSEQLATRSAIGYTEGTMTGKPTSYYVYVLRCTDGSYYTGWTTDVARRVRQHNAGRGARYTRQRRPVELVYWEAQPDRGAAMKRESQIKRQGRKGKQQLVERGPQ